MNPKLFAFDLDGTLLDSDKRIRAGNAEALRAMAAGGAMIALASGRLGSAVRRYVPEIGVVAGLVTLNGAEVFASADAGARRIYYAPLDGAVAGVLTDFGKGRPIMVNFYRDDNVYTVRSRHNTEWATLYHQQTGVNCVFIDDFAELGNAVPSKIIFVGARDYLDEVETCFRSMWADGSVYVCRSWDHYLEFMDPLATKGLGLAALCRELGVRIQDTAAYGDAENDVPMFEAAGVGVAMKNAAEKVKAYAERTTELTNDEDWIAREYERFFK